MSIFSYHLIQLTWVEVFKRIYSNPLANDTPGLVHSEFMTVMTLGSPIFSPSRILIREAAIFAQWENEMALNRFLEHNNFGKKLAKGWHVRMKLLRQWGKYTAFKIPPGKEIEAGKNSPVIAVTIARMKPLEVPRFIHWGRPVEKLVRDHPATSLSLASYRFPNTVSTFSIWKSEIEMTGMVHGHSAVPNPHRHASAMKERERKNFHFEFTTLRFAAIEECGTWKGQNNFISTCK